MKKIVSLAIIACVLTACSNEAPKAPVKLTCNDNPEGRSKEERQQIADACFLRGTFKKSPHMEW